MANVSEINCLSYGLGIVLTNSYEVVEERLYSNVQFFVLKSIHEVCFRPCLNSFSSALLELSVPSSLFFRRDEFYASSKTKIPLGLSLKLFFLSRKTRLIICEQNVLAMSVEPRDICHPSPTTTGVDNILSSLSTFTNLA